MSNLVFLETFSEKCPRPSLVDLSIVIPCCNEEQNIPILIAKIHEVMNPLNIVYEILIIDDGSRDNTQALLNSLSQNDLRLSFICLTRNYGHQVALTAGLKNCQGETAIAMDGDFQHPPREIQKLYTLWKNSKVDVIQTRRRENHHEKDILKKFLSKSFYRAMNFLFRCRLVEGGADFRLLGPRLLLDVKRSDRSSIFHRGFCAQRKYDFAIYNFDVDKRRFGYSKYILTRQLHLALMGIFEILGLGSKFPGSFVPVGYAQFHQMSPKPKMDTESIRNAG